MTLCSRFLMTTALVCAPFLVQAQTISDVTLSSAGLAQYYRAVPMDDSPITVDIAARMEEMNDILKSLTILGSGVASASLSVGAASALQDVFETLPFEPEDLMSPARLLAALTGQEVHVRSDMNAPGVVGRIMGVSEQACDEAPCASVVFLQSETGLVQVVLREDISIVFVDDRIKEQVNRGLEALARYGHDVMRVVEVSIEPKPDNTDAAIISTVHQAPAWKPSYRGIVAPSGAIDLQAWAVIENASGYDWDDVNLTLVSGHPRVIQADLYRQLFPEPVMEQHAEMFSMRSAVPSAAMGSAMSMDMAEVAPMPQAVATEGEAGARFQFPDAVSIRAGDVASVPFLQEALDMRSVAYYEGGYGAAQFGAPRRVLDVKSDLDVRLPAGVVTLYASEEGYLGDTMMPEIHPGERHVLDFGTETRLRVREVQNAPGSGVVERRFSIQDGILIAQSERVQRIQYDMRGADRGSFPFVLDHPVRDGVQITVLEGDDPEQVFLNRTREVLRFDMTLAEGDERRVVVEERSPQQQQWRLMDLSTTDIMAFSGREMDNQTRRFLMQLVELRAVEADAVEALTVFEQDRAFLVSEQERLSGMLQSLAIGSSAHDRFSADLLSLEDRLSGLDRDRKRLQDAVTAAREAVTAHLRG